jgi:ATP-binding cassette, subfamily B, bacterial
MKAFIPLIRRYKWWVTLVSILGLAANVLAILVPKISARIIDHIQDSHKDIVLLVSVAVGTLIVAAVQIICSTYFSEKVALDLRHKLIEKVSGQTFGYIATSTPGRLLTVITSDIDAVKGVIAQGLIALLGAAVTRDYPRAYRGLRHDFRETRQAFPERSGKHREDQRYHQ